MAPEAENQQGRSVAAIYRKVFDGGASSDASHLRRVAVEQRRRGLHFSRDLEL